MKNKPEHSPIGASIMYRFSVCPGSVRMSKGKESPQSEYAKEGTKAHDFAAKWLLKKRINLKEISEEMAEHVGFYTTHVEKLVELGDTLLVEHEFDLGAVYPGAYGTADVVIWKPKIKKLIVIDLKYGAGILVEAVDNPQLNYYALGALITCGFPAETIEMQIVQPRVDHPDGPVRSHTIRAIELYDFSIDLKEYAQATEALDAPLVSGDHCRFCPAAASCPELQRQTQIVAKTEFRSDLTYDPEMLKKALDSRPAIQAWLKALDEFAYAEAEAGRPPIGYKLVNKRPSRKWKDEEEAKKAFEFDEGAFAPKKLKTPAQMEKVFEKKDVEKYAEKVSSGHTLVPESDKREAVKPSAKAEFTEVTVEEVK